MRGFSRQRDYVALDAADGGNDADMLICRFQHRALFQMKLDPTEYLLGVAFQIGKSGWVEPKVLHRLP